MAEAGRLVVRIFADATQFQAVWGQLLTMTNKFGAEIQKSIQNMSAGFKRVMDDIKAMPSMLGNIGEKLSFIGRVAAGIIVADLFFNMVRAIRSAMDAFTSMESTLKRLAIVSASTGREFAEFYDQLRQAALDAAIKFGIGVDESAKALEALVKAGLQGSDAIRALNDALAAAKLEGTSVENVTRNLVMVMAQFSMRAEESNRVMAGLLNMSRLGIGTMEDFAKGLGNVGATANALGISLEETGALLVLLERRLGSADEAGTALNRALRNIYEAAMNLGVPIRDLEGNLRNTLDIFFDVVEAVKTFGDNTDLLFEKLRGIDERGIRAFLFMSKASREELERLRQEMQAGLTVQGAYIRSLGTLADIQDRVAASGQRMLGGVFSEMWANVMRNFMGFLMTVNPALKTTENLISLMAYDVKNMFDAMVKGSEEGVLALSINVASAWEKLKGVMKPDELKGFALVIEDWIAMFEKAGLRVPEIFLKIQAELREKMGGTTQVVVDEFGRMANAAEEGAQGVAKSTKTLIENLLNMPKTLIDTAKDLKGALKDMMTLGEFVGPGGVLLGFLKWVELFKTIQTEAEKLRGAVDTNFSLLAQTVRENATVFGDYLASQVRTGAISLEDAINLVEQLANAVTGFPKEDIIKKIIDADKAREAQKEIDRTRKEMEKLKQEAEQGRARLAEWFEQFTQGEKKLGVFTSQLDTLNKIINDLNSKGIKVQLSLPLQQLRDFIGEMNNLSIQLNLQNQTYGLMSGSVSWLTQAYRTQGDVLRGLYGAGNLAIKEYMKLVKEKNGLTQEEYQRGLQLIEYLRKEGVIREADVALLKQVLDLNIRYQQMKKEERESYARLVDTVEGVLQEKERDVDLTLEQEATLIRLQGIQSVLNTYTQFNTLAMQAMQFAMLGNTEAANKLAGFLRKLAGTTEDGYMDTQEYVDVLKELGVTFDEQGKPVFNFSEYLKTLATTIENNTNKVNDLIKAINNLQGKHIVITVETRHITTGGGGGGSGSITHQTEGRFFEAPSSGTTTGGGTSGGGTGSGGGGSSPITHRTGGRFFEATPPGTTTPQVDEFGNPLTPTAEPQVDEFGQPLQHGAWRIPRPMLARLHEGEMVVPQMFADAIRSVISGEPKPSRNITVNINFGGWPAGLRFFYRRAEWEDLAKLLAYRIREVL